MLLAALKGLGPPRSRLQILLPDCTPVRGNTQQMLQGLAGQQAVVTDCVLGQMTARRQGQLEQQTVRAMLGICPMAGSARRRAEL